MCQSKSEGGRRCPSTLTGRSLARLYGERKDHPDRASEIASRIESLKIAEKKYGGKFVASYHMKLPEGVELALKVARTVGNPLIVGGAVRDSMLGAESKDTDIEVHGTTFVELSSAFRKAGFSVDEVGKQFGVLKVSKKGVVSDLDVSIPRRENAVGAGHRDFSVEHGDMTVIEAAERRDFTINALMYDPSLGVIVDPFDGGSDFKKKTLRAVSSKFAEDPLRVLRGVQFAGRFGMTMDSETASMCRGLRPQYASLAKERVADEWMKLFTKGTDASAALKVLRDTGWDDTLPGLKSAAKDPSVISSLGKLGSVPRDYRASVGAALVSRGMSEGDRKQFIRASTVGGDTARLSNALVDAESAPLDTPYERKVFARSMEKAGFTFEKFKDYSSLANNSQCVSRANKAIREGLGQGSEPPLIQGRDLLPLTDQKPGPWLGKAVNEALDAQYRGEFSTREDAVKWAERLMAAPN